MDHIESTNKVLSIPIHLSATDHTNISSNMEGESHPTTSPPLRLSIATYQKVMQMIAIQEVKVSQNEMKRRMRMERWTKMEGCYRERKREECANDGLRKRSQVRNEEKEKRKQELVELKNG